MLRLRAYLEDRNRLVVAAFAAFLLITFLFAFLYYRAWRLDRTNFLFAGDLSSKQAATVSQQLFRRDSLLRLGTLALDQSLALLPTNPPWLQVSTQFTRIPTSSGLWVVLDRGAGDNSISTLAIDSPDDETISSWAIAPALALRTDPIPLAQLLADFKSRLLEEREQLKNQLSTITTASPDIWGYWDFLYFSAITQGTVGYGDILPNSRFVRMLVVSQIFLSYSIVLVVLNVVVRRRPATP